jgi:hypothetical protein
MWSTGSTFAKSDFNNPGPLLYDLLAVPTALFGTNGQPIGIGLLNASALVGIAVVARRRGGPLLATAAVAVVTTLGWTMGSKLLFDPWAPNSLLFVSLLVLLLAWCVTAGDLLALPLMAAVGSLLLQTNLSYALLAPALGAWGVLGLVFHLRHERRADPHAWPELRRRAWRTGAVSAIVVGVLWAQTFIEQLTAEGGGNLTLIARGYRDLTMRVGMREGIRLVAGVTALPIWWLRGSMGRVYSSPPSFEIALVATLALGALLGMLAWSARRREDHLASAGIATAVFALVVALVSVVRAPVLPSGLLWPYRTRFLWPVAAFVTLVAVVTLARGIRHAARRQAIVGAFTVITMVVALLNLQSYKAAWGTHEPDFAIPIMQDLKRQLGGVIGAGTLYFDWEQGKSFDLFYASGVLAELARRDVPFVVKQKFLVRTFGEARRFTGDNADAVLTIRTGYEALAAPRGARRVALHEALSRDERLQLSTLRERITGYVRDGGLHLTGRGSRALAALGSDHASASNGFDAETLVASRSLLRLFGQGFLVLDNAWQRRFDRYAFLEQLSDARTVGVFLARP